MAEITKEEIHSMIEHCIDRFKEGKLLERDAWARSQEMLSSVARSKGISKTDFAELYYTPHAVLMEASRLGLIASAEHKKFIADVKTLIEMEGSLLALKHIAPDKFKKILEPILHKSIEERFNSLGRLSDLNLLEEIKRINALGKKHSKMRSPTPEGRASLEKYLKERERQIGTLASLIKSRIERKFAKPDYRQRLLDASRNVRGRSGKKELEILQKYLKAYDKWKTRPGQTPIRKPRPV